VAAKKPNRQQLRAKQAARAARAAELVRRKQARKRRMTIGAVIAVIAATGILAVLLASGDDGTDVASTTSTTATQSTTASTAAAPRSAAGKPCVEVAEALTAGSPPVPVKVGAPPTELVVEDLKPGTGAVVAEGQTLKVNYIGVACSTGKIFDSSYSRNEPAEFPLSGVIAGWQQGIPGMKVGGQRLLGIPSAMAYGPQGRGADIAPDEPLWFVVEVLEAKAAG
jgi:peptidylprolyl isomerase